MDGEKRRRRGGGKDETHREGRRTKEFRFQSPKRPRRIRSTRELKKNNSEGRRQRRKESETETEEEQRKNLTSSLVRIEYLRFDSYWNSDTFPLLRTEGRDVLCSTRSNRETRSVGIGFSRFVQSTFTFSVVTRFEQLDEVGRSQLGEHLLRLSDDVGTSVLVRRSSLFLL